MTNRAQRRAQEKADKKAAQKVKSIAEKKHDGITDFEIAKVIDRERYKAFCAGENIGFANAFLLMAWMLHTKHGFGEKRLKDLYVDMKVFAQAFMAQPDHRVKYGKYDGISIDDIAAALDEECNIKIDTTDGLLAMDAVWREKYEAAMKAAMETEEAEG